MKPHIEAQRVVVRMLFDPQFARAVQQDPEQVLADLPLELRTQLATLDPRALRLDGLRRRRALRTLSDEWKGTTTLVLAETRSLAFLEQFFASTPFHRAVAERGSMPLAFAEFLAEAIADGRLNTPLLGDVLALETALAQARRAGQASPPAPAAPARSDGERLALSPGVIAVEVAAGALAALQQAEHYLFEVGLMPAVALCEDAPRLVLDARAADRARLHLVTVPMGSGVSLVTVDAELHRVVRAFSPDGAPRALAAILAEAVARGVPEPRARVLITGLVDDEIAVRA